MSEQPRSTALQAYRAKCREVEHRFAKHLIAYVRMPASAKMAGFIVYATNGDVGMYKHENFTAFYVAPRDAQFKDVHNIIESAEQKAREIYGPKSKDFYPTHALTSLGAYARYILEEWGEPRGLAVLGVVLDCIDNLRMVDYTGYVSQKEPMKKGGASIFLLGCYDKSVRPEINKAIRKFLLGRPPTKASRQRLAKVLRQHTGLRRTGSIPISR